MITEKTTLQHSNPPIEAKQTNLHGFLPSFCWPDYVSNLSILW